MTRSLSPRLWCLDRQILREEPARPGRSHCSAILLAGHCHWFAAALQCSCVPHHLLDFVGPTSYITAGEYARLGRQVLEEIKFRGHLPIVVGGTGLYLRTLLEGLFPGPQRSEELRDRLRQGAQSKGSAYLHRLLHRLDPAAA